MLFSFQCCYTRFEINSLLICCSLRLLIWFIIATSSDPLILVVHFALWSLISIVTISCWLSFAIAFWRVILLFSRSACSLHVPSFRFALLWFNSCYCFVSVALLFDGCCFFFSVTAALSWRATLLLSLFDCFSLQSLINFSATSVFACFRCMTLDVKT